MIIEILLFIATLSILYLHYKLNETQKQLQQLKNAPPVVHPIYHLHYLDHPPTPHSSSSLLSLEYYVPLLAEILDADPLTPPSPLSTSSSISVFNTPPPYSINNGNTDVYSELH